MDKEKDIKELKNKELEKVSGGSGAFDHPTYVVNTNMCIGCGACENDCPMGSIRINGDFAAIDQEMCVQCGTCADICPMGAISMVG